jgi:hypothetical protein
MAGEGEGAVKTDRRSVNLLDFRSLEACFLEGSEALLEDRTASSSSAIDDLIDFAEEGISNGDETLANGSASSMNVSRSGNGGTAGSAPAFLRLGGISDMRLEVS